MLDLEAACELVSNRGWLRHTPVPFRRAVLERCRLQQFAAGTPVYSIGDEPGGMYGVVSGALGISVAPGEHGPYTAHLAMSGAWFGEAAAFTRRPRMVGLTATRDTELLHLPLHAIDDIVSRDPGAWRYFGLITIGQLDIAIGASDDLMTRDHFRRFVAVLLRFANCRHVSPRNGLPSISTSVMTISPIWPMSPAPRPAPSCASSRRTGILHCPIAVSAFWRPMP